MIFRFYCFKLIKVIKIPHNDDDDDELFYEIVDRLCYVSVLCFIQK